MGGVHSFDAYNIGFILTSFNDIVSSAEVTGQVKSLPSKAKRVMLTLSWLRHIF
jgi:hypothetical protein